MESHGMLLCAVEGSNHEKCEIVEPPEGSKPGERIFIKELPITPADDVIDNKSNAWDNIQPYLKATNESKSTYCDCELITSKGVLKCKSLKNCQLS